jgi:LPS export ABC transporter protein LptC
MKQKVLYLIMFAAASCETDIEKVQMITSEKNLPVESAKNMEVLYSDSAKVKVKIMAGEVNRFAGASPYTEMKKGVKLEFFDDSLKVTSQLTANNAVSKEQEQIMEAKNNVVVINEKGEKLETEHLVWDEKKEKIYTDVFARITTDDEIIYGNGFESNQEFTRYRILQPKGIITIKK